MSLDNIKQETEQLKKIDINQLSIEQLNELVEKVGNIIEKSEEELLKIKIEEK